MTIKINRVSGLIIGLIVGFAAAQSSHAHHVYDFSDHSGNVGTLGPVTWVTDADGNDDAADAVRDLRNTLSVNKTFNQLGQPFEIRFLIEAFEELAPNVTEYAVTEVVTNNTESQIRSIELQIGFDLASAFLPSANPDGLDFDQESPPGHFSGLDIPIPQGIAPHTTTLDFCLLCERITLTFDQAVQPGESFTLEYQLDVPSLFQELGGGFNIPTAYLVGGNAAAVTAAGFTNVASDPFAGGFHFTLRQTLVPVPIPGALWLCSSGLLALVSFARRPVA